jgi:hypothetical protein
MASKASTNEQPLREYHAPKLVELGPLGVRTLASASGSNSDSGSYPDIYSS